MKHLRFLPLAFVAGVDGFNLFAPYLALVIAATPLIAWARRRRQRGEALSETLSPAAATA